MSVSLISKIFRKFPSIFFLLRWTALSMVVGFLAGSASAFFLVALDWATNWRESHVLVIALLPIGGFIVGLMYHYLGKDVEAGNNLLLENITHSGKIISLKMAPFVLIGTLVTHFFGGSAGREGTALQMGGSIADQLTRLLNLRPRDRKLILIAGIAAGFGSVFGTPLAGAVFSLEVVLIGRIRYDALFPAFAASIFADLTTRAWHVGHTGYQISGIPVLNITNVLLAILAGIIFGLGSVVFGELSHKVGKLFRSYIIYPPFRPLFGGIIVAIAVWAFGSTRYIGLGIPVIVEAFDNQIPWYDFALKIAFTVVTLGASFKGGEVTPLFFIGATLGNTISHFIPLPMDLLAGMGFVAVFAGAANTPLACTLMAVELFGVDCGIYMALACITAYFISGHNGIYSSQVIGHPKHILFGKQTGKKLSSLEKQ